MNIENIETPTEIPQVYEAQTLTDVLAYVEVVYAVQTENGVAEHAYAMLPTKSGMENIIRILGEAVARESPTTPTLDISAMVG